MTNQITYSKKQARLANVLSAVKTKQGHHVEVTTTDDSIVVAWSAVTVEATTVEGMFNVMRNGEQIATILCGLYGQDKSVYSLIGYHTPINEPIVKAATLDYVKEKAYSL
ncbi:MAG: hypothetical protein ACRDCE_09485 [Cetobacterium sp.]|uniref:hypothetical protein n=1 Tax=Cetobacterium sp. TaxID=2071632 RepID=UPI003EE4972E